MPHFLGWHLHGSNSQSTCGPSFYIGGMGCRVQCAQSARGSGGIEHQPHHGHVDWNPEYRWEIFSALDGALFYDAGKVAPRFGDLNFDDLKSDYGIGFRFGTSNGVFLRIEGAFGIGEGGNHFVMRYGHVF